MSLDPTESLYEYLEDFPRGHSISGDLMPFMSGIFDNADVGDLAEGRHIAGEPGDMARGGKDHLKKLFLASPIAYDIYYLFKHKSILPDDRDEGRNWIENDNARMKSFFDIFDGIKPMLGPASFEDLRGCSDFPDVKDYYEENAPYIIKEMRFEAPLTNQDLTYPAKINKYADDRVAFKTKQDELYPREDGYIAYLAFPISQLGVMKILSVIFESQNYEWTTIDEGFLENKK